MTATMVLSGKTAIVTDASSGLGACFAKVLAGAGAEVVLAARREAQLEQVAAAIRAKGGVCSTVALDVTSNTSIDALRDQLHRIDILVNNAGMVREASMFEQSEQDWDAVIDTNLKGMFLMTQVVASAMKAAGRGGSIINIASILGLRQGGMVLPYAVSKAGAIQLAKVFALELARYGIRVNAIAPGYFEADLHADF